MRGKIIGMLKGGNEICYISLETFQFMRKMLTSASTESMRDGDALKRNIIALKKFSLPLQTAIPANPKLKEGKRK